MVTKAQHKTIALRPSQYQTLLELKNAHEAQVGPTNWGEFLLLLAGLYFAYTLLRERQRESS